MQKKILLIFLVLLLLSHSVAIAKQPLLIVVAVDRQNGKAVNGLRASLDGGARKDFNSENSVSFTVKPRQKPFLIRLHKIPRGYMFQEDPSKSGQVRNPNNSLYGHPRKVRAKAGQVVSANFALMPYVTIIGSVQDAKTGEALSGVKAIFKRGDIITDTIPIFTEWGTEIITDSSGALPEQCRVWPRTWNLVLTKPGYREARIRIKLTYNKLGTRYDIGIVRLTPQ